MYRVVFCGEIAKGFEPAKVYQAASQRMRASPEQLSKVFSGRSVVLKKGLNDQKARYYVEELQKIGMLVRAEREPGAPQLTTKSTPAHSVSQSTDSVVGLASELGADEWAIASIHDPIQAYMSEGRPEPEVTNLNTASLHRFAPSVDTVQREPGISADSLMKEQPVPGRLDFDSLARHLASSQLGSGGAVNVSLRSAENRQNSPRCPHCGQVIDPSFVSRVEQDSASLAIRPLDRLQVTAPISTDPQPGSSIAKIAAKITSIFPGRAEA